VRGERTWQRGWWQWLLSVRLWLIDAATGAAATWSVSGTGCPGRKPGVAAAVALARAEREAKRRWGQRTYLGVGEAGGTGWRRQRLSLMGSKSSYGGGGGVGGVTHKLQQRGSARRPRPRWPEARAGSGWLKVKEVGVDDVGEKATG
jgi:hypothetical protein